MIWISRFWVVQSQVISEKLVSTGVAGTVLEPVSLNVV